VFDYLQAHTVDDLLGEVKKAPRYVEAATPVSKPFFVTPARILPYGAPGVQWILPGVIHRGAKGRIVAQPKAGKTMVALDLAVALSSGQPFLGIEPASPVRTAIVSREDGPGMTQHRLQQFAKSRGLDFSALPALFVNTFEQRSSFAIDNDED